MLNYCIVKQRIGAITEDTPDDDDRYPDYTSVFGQVVFAPTMANGSAYKITDDDGVVHTVPATRITAQIVNGEITHEGLPGLPLFAAGPNANPSTIVYTATYSNLTAAGRPVDLNSITFRAVPGETIDLSSYTPVAGAPTPGIIQGPPGHTPFIGGNGNWWIGGKDTGVAATSPLVHSYTELTEAYEENTMRVKSLEAMNGVSPESPVDGQTANLISQPSTLTRAALEAVQEGYMSAPDEYVPLGEDLITDSGWTLGAGWTGTTSDGFNYDGVGGGSLTWDIPDLISGSVYVVGMIVTGFDVNNNFPGDFELSIAGVDVGPMYRANGNDVISYIRGFTPSDPYGPLVVTPKATTSMGVSEVSLRNVVGGFSPTSTWRSASGDPVVELRANDSSLFIGDRAGRRHMGDTSVGIGTRSMENDVTGFFNTAVGFESLRASQRATRNTAIGFQSLSRNVSGPRNTAVGSFAGYGIRSGERNTAIGVDSMFASAAGNNNVAVGVYALGNAEDINNCIAIGVNAARYTLEGTRNVAIGDNTLQKSLPGSENVAIGGSSLMQNLGNGSTAVGVNSGTYSGGGNNVIVGKRALNGVRDETTAKESVVIGESAGYALTTGSNNVLIGRRTGFGLTTGHTNTIIGHRIAESLTTGYRNVLIGDGAASTLETGIRNIIIGGEAESPGVNDWVNIGDLIYGRKGLKNMGVGVQMPRARIHLAASTGASATAPIKIDRGPLTPAAEDGIIEFDGTGLYFSIGTTRYKIAFDTTE